jgi:hypothetical protein
MEIPAICQKADGFFPAIINTTPATAIPHALTCLAPLPRYPLTQMLAFGSPRVSIAKTEPVWVLRLLPNFASCGRFDPGFQLRVAALET